MGPLLLKPAPDTAPAHGLIANLDADFGRVNGNSRSPNGGEDAPPIRIGAGSCGLYQQRMGHGSGHLPGFLAILCLFNGQMNHMFYPFAVGHNLLG
jgi:hypothetical protein